MQHQVLEYIRTFSYVPAWESGYRPGVGVVTGVVTQGTADMSLSPGITVTLDGYINFEPVVSLATEVDSNGAFTFTNLAVGEEIVYLATVVSDGVSYSSPIVRLTSTAPEIATDIIVYATTTEPVGLRLDRTHWIIDSQPGSAHHRANSSIWHGRRPNLRRA